MPSALLTPPLLTTGVILLAILLGLLILLTACSAAAAQRLVRLLEALQHLVHGTCRECGQTLKASNSRSKRIQKGKR